MTELYVGYAVLGAVVLMLGTFSGFLRRRTILSDPLVAVLVGLALGPAWLGWLDPNRWGPIEILVEEATRLTLGIALMSVALRLPPRYTREHWKEIAVLVGGLMPLMWIATGLLVFAFPGLPFWVAMLAGAVLTPTDPVVASSIVTGSLAEEALPDRIRHNLSGEAGANDGLAYPFVLGAVLALTKPAGEAAHYMVMTVLLHHVIGGIVLGIAAGYGAGRLLLLVEQKKLVDKVPYLSYTIALSILSLGVARIIGVEAIIAVFVTGLTFDAVVGERERSDQEGVQEMMTRFFTLPVFVFLGLVLPVHEWIALGWSAVALALAIILFRRLPWILLIKPLLGNVRPLSDCLFLGWFGPMGVAAVFYSVMAVRHTRNHEIWAIATLVVSTSIVVHGISATPLTKLYARIANRS